MDLGQYALALREALKAKKCVMISCNCSIMYSGRAESFLDFGDRMIVIKEDATLLVHQREGSNPVNYMKQDSFHIVSFHKGVIKIKSKHIALKEFMDIEIKEIYGLHARLLEDHKSIVIQGTEKDMSDMIFAQPSLIEPGFKPLSQEEHTLYGFIDVFGYDKDNVLTIIECKRFVADPKAVDQLQRYVRKIKSSKGVDKVRGILAAPRISPNAQKMLDDLKFEFRQINPPKYLERYHKDQRALKDFA